jgi:hypothetical protein
MVEVFQLGTLNPEPHNPGYTHNQIIVLGFGEPIQKW